MYRYSSVEGLLSITPVQFQSQMVSDSWNAMCSPYNMVPTLGSTKGPSMNSEEGSESACTVYSHTTLIPLSKS